jgi:hypothetical protein
MERVEITKYRTLQSWDGNDVRCPFMADAVCRSDCALFETERQGANMVIRLHCAGGTPRVFSMDTRFEARSSVAKP